MIISKTSVFIESRSSNNLTHKEIKYLIHEFLINESKEKRNICLVCKIPFKNLNDFLCEECKNVLYQNESNINNLVIKFYDKYELVRNNKLAASPVYNEISLLIECGVFKDKCSQNILINLCKMLHLINLMNMVDSRRKCRFKLLFLIFKSLKMQYKNVFYSDDWSNLFILHDKLEETLKEINQII